MSAKSIVSSRKLSLRAPILFLVLAATAVPVGLHAPSLSIPEFRTESLDFTQNIVLYVPVGFVLASLGPARAIAVAAGMSLLAETSQLFMQHRIASIVDFVTNLIGAALGMSLCVSFRIFDLSCHLSKGTAFVAAVLAAGLFPAVWYGSGNPLNARGSTAPGALEADWELDENEGTVVLDSSGHGLKGSLQHQAARVPGIRGKAVECANESQYIDFGRAPAFRLTGSMTISAWFNASSFPRDDAAIVSTAADELGYQLDTTIDRGPRTLGFKLTNACGGLMARYGATPLRAGVWYHGAGVYDAEYRTLDVYLNGHLDNAFLVGPVTDRQRSPRRSLYVGKRTGVPGFEFSGAIDGLRLYSFALTKEQVLSDMYGTTARLIRQERAARVTVQSALCSASVERPDARLPAAAGLLGVLVGVICLGLWPTAGRRLCACVGLAAGAALLQVMSTMLPAMSRWWIPFVSLAGAVTVAISAGPSSERRIGE